VNTQTPPLPATDLIAATVEPQRPFLLSIVTPAYNEAANLPLLYQALAAVLDSRGIAWEWVVVDDHSSDGTFAAASEIAAARPGVRVVRFARNFGSHTAIACGLHHAVGDCAAVMAADLQDPPATLVDLIDKWKSGSQVVWAVRGHRKGEKASTLGFSRLYYWLMRRIAGLSEMPGEGADFLLIDRVVIDAFRQFPETNVSILALITWMGFRQNSIVYTKQARLHGSSGWSLEKKLKLVVDSITSFTYLPIRLMTYAGFLTAMAGFLYAGWVLVNAWFGKPSQGWTSLMVVVLVVGGMQMLMMGTLGEYLWRTLDESRRRPRYFIESSAGTTGTRHNAHD
jgi:polyisoprenyl-phosphate glycosyltransferase